MNLRHALRKSQKRSVIFEVIFELADKEQSLQEIEKKTQNPDFWANSIEAQKILKERKVLRDVVDGWKQLNNQLEENTILLELAIAENDEEVRSEIESNLDSIIKEVEDVEFRHMLNGENDFNNAFVNINAGAGGTEAQDWAEMLLRMYLMWAERKKFKTEIIEILAGDEAGIKSVTFSTAGDYSYGYLKAEVGIHRLVRISPYDAGKRRHTSFASVFVYPEIEDDIAIEVDESELRIDTYRASGAGGQHVNKTDSAVRITHLPSGIVAQCQNERSQHKNKAMAMKVLKARLYEHQKEEQDKQMDELHSNKMQIAWGSQIRSYVMQPYRMVKDHRTNKETGNVESVLNGNLDDFIKEYLINK
jgi:peptide chain release factor 2